MQNSHELGDYVDAFDEKNVAQNVAKYHFCQQ
jgi:hypothetical protein